METFNHNSSEIKTVDIKSLGNNDRFGFFTIGGDNYTELSDIPVTVNAGGICICTQGDCDLIINERSYCLRKGDICVAFPGTVLQGVRRTPDFEGFTIAVETEFIKNINVPSASVLYVYIKENPCITPTPQQLSFLLRMGETASENVLPTDHIYRNEIVRHFLLVFAYAIAAIYQQGRPLDRLPRTRQESIFRRFEYLLAQHYTDARSVAWYADKLCITPKYLSLIVKRCSGYNAADWIARTVIINAKALLRNSDLSVQQVSDKLNFPSPSFFGHYFKRETGITPKQYRNLD